jgi:HSP20 family molecular chaperone IbpA
MRPSFSSVTPFLSELDDIISALEHEARREAAQREEALREAARREAARLQAAHREAARREAHRQRQQRKRIVRAHFNVHEHQEGYQIDAELPGFEQHHIQIEMADDNTLRLSGNTERIAEHQSQQTETDAQTQAIEPEAHDEAMDGVTLEGHEETAASGAATPTHSDTESHRSYQATVEDDFEDLGAETSSTVSSHTDSEAPKEPKGKEKATEELAPEKAAQQQQQPQPEVAAHHPQEEDEEWRFHGLFERTFRFPERIDAANVTASFRNGVLSISIPKAKVPEVRRILIQ